MKKVLAIFMLILLFLVFAYGYSSRELTDESNFTFTTTDAKIYVSKFNKLKDLVNDYVEKVKSNITEDFTFLINRYKFLDFAITGGFTASNFLLIMNNILTILFFPVNFLITIILIVFQFISLTFMYLFLLLTWAIGLGGAL